MEWRSSLLLWCVVRVVEGPLYSLERSVPAISLYGNIANRLLEDQINLPTKMHLDGKQGWFGRPHFTASGNRPSLVHCLVGPDVRWSVLGLGWLVWSVRWAHFVSETQVAIFCAFLVRSLVFSFVFNLWVPADHNSPKLVEPISKKPYN